MILDAILNIFFNFLRLLISLLPPSQGLPDTFTTSFDFFIAQATQWNNFFPVTALFTVLGLTFALEAGIFGFKSFNWIINKVRGSGG